MCIRDSSNPNRELGSEKNIQPFEEKIGRGSTDVGGVSWVCILYTSDAADEEDSN